MIEKFSNRLVMSCFVLAILVAACKKTGGQNSGEDLYRNSPSSTIPNELKTGLWFWGGLGPISYYDRDGHQVGNGTEAARQYGFTETAGQGRFEFIQYLGLRNSSNCVTEIYTTKKGTVKFDNDKVTFYPVEGNFKTVKTGCPDNGTTNRAAKADDLTPETYLWEVKDVNGDKALYIYNPTDAKKQDVIFVYKLQS